jgi:hypothetical protein
MGSNPDWFDQQRARGICYICHRPMRDDDPRRRHSECEAEARRGRRYAEIRQAPPPLNERRSSIHPTDTEPRRREVSR